MKIGILSDTHNDIMMLRRALGKLKTRGVTLVVHAGDLTSPEMISVFEGFETRFVLGNCDIDHSGIISSCKCSGFSPATRFCEFELEEKKFFLIHGDDTKRYLEAVNSKKYDYIIIGHTHEFMARRKHNTLVINPGAVTRDTLTNVGQTCAVLNVQTGEVEKISLA